MADLDLHALKTSLASRRTELTDEIARMQAEIQSIGVEQGIEGGSTGNHFADDGSSVMEAERLATMSADMNGILLQIDSALDRLDTGGFGVCQRCHQKINPERLEAFPYVAYCIDCQAILEREHSLHTVS